MSKIMKIIIDANEANTIDRVGSNIYAFEILRRLEYLTRKDRTIEITVLLSSAPQKDLPKPRSGWQYVVFGPSFLWTQLALPIYLFFYQNNFNVLLSLSHYAPRISYIPYISCVMDLAFLKFPNQFTKKDLTQLKCWTKYSVKSAAKVVAISEFTKKEVIRVYNKNPEDVIVAYPSISLQNSYTSVRYKSFFRKNRVATPYIVYLGTLQPRKNLVRLIEAFEKFSQTYTSFKQRLGLNLNLDEKPQLVIAGKTGWLAEKILAKINNSAVKDQIILTGYVPDELKQPLLENAACSVLVGLYEGFGIPALESLSCNTIPVVSNNTSLPEVVGSVGVLVDPMSVDSIKRGIETAWTNTIKKKNIFKIQAKRQVLKFSWEKSAQVIIDALKEVALKK